MVLVDTSVWLRFAYDRSPQADELARLLVGERVVGHELIYGEMLIGDRGGRGKFLAAYQLMEQASRVPHDEVVEFVRMWDLQGRGAGWIDIHLLASAVAGGFQFWTADSRLGILAQEIGVGYQVRSGR